MYPSNATMAIIYNAISFYKYLDCKWDRTFGCIAVTVAVTVTGTVLLVVGSVLSTLNGKYTCLSINSYIAGA